MIGIRREDKNRWERRVPLTPDHVAELVQEHGIVIRIQPSPLRAFPDIEYQRAGARVDEELAGCRVVLGVKEIPTQRLTAGTCYVFFSHVTKGQRYNMPMLRRLMDLRCTLIDYEQIRDERGRRFVFFGRYAGYAGMIDTLWALGQRLAAEGFPTSLEQVRLAHRYSGLDEATQHISRLGEELRHEGIPEALRPLVVGFTGSGNVSLGAQEILDRLPTQAILPEELERLATEPERPRRLLYKVVFQREDRFRRVGGGSLDAAELKQFPERYVNGLRRWLPALTVLVHGAFWLPHHPRVVSREELRGLWQAGRSPRLRVIADISCDVGGGVEANRRATTPGDPVYVYDPESNGTQPGVEGRGPVVMAVDNLPCQLPVESSSHFGDHLLRYVPVLARTRWDLPLDEFDLPPELKRAVIVHRGELTPSFARLAGSLPV